MSIVEISDFTGYVLPSVRAEKIVRGIYCRNAAVRADFLLWICETAGYKIWIFKAANLKKQLL